jgi:hypothetical protein
LANAQVVVNRAALDQLAGITAVPAAVAAPVKPVVVRDIARRVVVRKTVIVAVAKPAAPVAAVPVVAKPVVPVVVPQAARPPAPAPVAALKFAGGVADLPSGAAAALKPFCSASGMVVITALAPADPSDRSAALRLSMNRAFAVRDALTACGVPSSHILPRALGSVDGQDEDVTKISIAP